MMRPNGLLTVVNTKVIVTNINRVNGFKFIIADEF